MRESNVKRDVCVGFKARTKITDISGRKSNIRLWHFSTYFLLARLHYDSISHFWRRKFPLSCLLVGVLIRYRLSITKISFTHRDIECVPRNHHMMKICLILMRFKENSSKNHLKGSGCFSNLTWKFFLHPTAMSMSNQNRINFTRLKISLILFLCLYRWQLEQISQDVLYFPSGHRNRRRRS